jgi:hypothetical protein
VADQAHTLSPNYEHELRHGLEHSLEGGEVRLTAKRQGAQLAIGASDTGLGFGSTSKDPSALIQAWALRTCASACACSMTGRPRSTLPTSPRARRCA